MATAARSGTVGTVGTLGTLGTRPKIPKAGLAAAREALATCRQSEQEAQARPVQRPWDLQQINCAQKSNVERKDCASDIFRYHQISDVCAYQSVIDARLVRLKLGPLGGIHEYVNKLTIY